jgi:hypothetical protein
MSLVSHQLRFYEYRPPSRDAMTSCQRKIALIPLSIYTTSAPFEPFAGGLISAILRKAIGFGLMRPRDKFRSLL